MAGRVGGPVGTGIATMPAQDAVALALTSLNTTLDRLRLSIGEPNAARPLEAAAARPVVAPGAARAEEVEALPRTAIAGAVGAEAAAGPSPIEAGTPGAERQHAQSLTSLTAEEKSFTAASDMATAAIQRETAALDGATASVRSHAQAKQQAGAAPQSPASAPMRQKWRVEEGGISGPS